MIKKIGVAVLVLGVVGALLIATRSDSFRVERANEIAAPAAIVYAQLVDFHRWNKFSPWEQLDPTMQRRFEGPDSGIGARYYWQGNNKVGEGDMTITDATPPEHLAINLVFKKPFAANNKVDFRIKAVDPKHALVSWVMTGTANFMHKAMSLVLDMDAMIGDDFERGLNNLKILSEAEAKLQEVKAAAAASAVPPANAPPAPKLSPTP